MSKFNKQKSTRKGVTPTPTAHLGVRVSVGAGALLQKLLFAFLALAVGLAVLLRYGSDFFAGVLVGAGGGLVIDRLLGWTPWGLIAGLILGFAAGTLNVVRAARDINASGDTGAKN